MSAPKRAIAAGTKYFYAGFLDPFGYLLGGDTSAPASGATGSGMYPIVGIKTASPTIPTPDVVQDTGDDELLGEFTFDSIATRAFTVDVAIHDSTFTNRMIGITSEVIGEIEFGALDTLNAPEFDMCFILQGRAKKQDSGVTGKKAWFGYVIPLATAKYLGRVAFEERAVAVFRFQITPQLASYMPTGVTISQAVIGTDGLRYRPFESDYPIHMMRHTGNGSIPTFTLDKQPINIAKTASYVRRIPATTLSVSTSAPYSTTLTANPANGAEVITVMEFNG